MAAIYPVDIENYTPTKSELQMYEALRDQLPPSDQVFYSIRWFDTDENGKRIDSECDFLIFDPNFGYLTVEVKGGVGISVENNSWNLLLQGGGNRPLERSPYEQAERSMRYFHDLFEKEFTRSYNGTYGFAVAFPFYQINQPLSASSPLELTIDLNDMGDLGRRVNEIFHYWKNKKNITIPFSSDEKDKLLHCLNRHVALSAAAGALIEVREKEFSKIDFVQDGILDALHYYHQVRILGGAGTGKTFIAMKKAVRDLKADKKVLFLSCNNELSRFVKSKIQMDTGMNVVSRTYEELIVDLIGKEVYDHAKINENGNKAFFDLIDDIPNDKKFDSIIVDEGQDFDEDMGLTVRMFMRDDHDTDLYVFYDINQNIFAHKSDNAFFIDEPPILLRYNIRNTARIYENAVETTNLGRDTFANQLLGVEPEEQTNKNKSQTIKELTTIVNRLLIKENVSNQSIVILSDVPFEQSILSNETRIGAYNISFLPLENVNTNEICFKTVKEFKGLEANVVIYLPSGDNETYVDEMARSLEYVALTRARYYLFILKTRNK